MKNPIHRIVPNIYTLDMEKSRAFYAGFLNMDLVMDMGWILTFASSDNPDQQISVLSFDKKGKLDNTATFISIEVSDIDKLYERARKQDRKIIYPITDEPWGVRRFFVEDPGGATINLLAHR